jgi:hypothetical protein
MRLIAKIVTGLLGLFALPYSALAAIPIIGGSYYAVQYEYSEFFAATDGRNFQVILAGNPFPNTDPRAVAQALLPAMQAAKPRPALTFTYDAAPERPHPWYRLVLVFDPALDLGSASVCRGDVRVRPPQPGTFYVYAIYCRDDLAMSETTAWTQASSPTDPAIGALFRVLFQVVWPDSGSYYPLNPNKQFRR